jgi:hypothetical protein
MNFKDVLSIVVAVLASLGGGGAIVLALSSWLGKVWANRLMEVDKAKYARDLEALKVDLTRASEDRTRKLQGLMRHYERQIEEFYGPLFNMVNQIFVANHVQYELLSARASKTGDKRINEENAEKVRDYFHTTYFAPFHDDIRSILRTKLYLVEGSHMPESFYLYLKHAAQERDQRLLWKTHKIDSSSVEGEPWPNEFYNDIKAGLDNAMKNFERCLEGLKADVRTHLLKSLLI